MALSLLINTLIPMVIFLPLGRLIRNGTRKFSQNLNSFVLGGVGWCLYSIIAFIPYYFMFSESSEENYISTIDDHRTLLFFMLIFLSILSEVIRFEFFKSPYFPVKNVNQTILFGIGWGVAEFLNRFLFFYETDVDQYFWSTVLLLIFVSISNAGLTTILLRSSENTKYVMFATFVKFFVEISFFGALGNVMEFNVRYGRLTFFFAVQVIMFYLTMKIRKIILPE